MPRLILGRRYRRRDGKISEPIQESGPGAVREGLPFKADGTLYTASGKSLRGALGQPEFDLVAPAPMPAADKQLCDLTLDDYRRGVRAVMSWGPA